MEPLNLLRSNLSRVRILEPTNRIYKHECCVSFDSPNSKALSVDGEFDNSEPDHEETHSVVILPEYVSLPFPSVELPEKVRSAVDAILLAEGAERKEQLATWTADKKKQM
ncbi:Ubiquitin carboxyl-terminal hydrolase 14, partial [Mucuna pruriens]